MVKIAPSMLSADFLHLEKDVEMVNTHADIFHLDIMDGQFVPNISYGFPICDAIARKATKPLDAHLMILNPDKYIKRFADLGVEMLSFHLEAVEDPRPILKQIKELGMKAGLALNPDRDIKELDPYYEFCDFVLIMTVQAGFGGQKFKEFSYERISYAKQLISKNGFECQIEVDGGVSKENASKLVEAGADILVAGSSVFNAHSPQEAIKTMR